MAEGEEDVVDLANAVVYSLPGGRWPVCNRIGLKDRKRRAGPANRCDRGMTTVCMLRDVLVFCVLCVGVLCIVCWCVVLCTVLLCCRVVCVVCLCFVLCVLCFVL